jgi:hypothetical protein
MVQRSPSGIEEVIKKVDSTKMTVAVRKNSIGKI